MGGRKNANRNYSRNPLKGNTHERRCQVEHVFESLEHLGQGKQKICKKCGKRETPQTLKDPCDGGSPMSWSKLPVFAKGKDYDPFSRT